MENYMCRYAYKLWEACKTMTRIVHELHAPVLELLYLCVCVCVCVWCVTVWAALVLLCMWGGGWLEILCGLP